MSTAAECANPGSFKAGGDPELETEALIEMMVDFTGGGQGRGMMALEMVRTRGCKAGPFSCSVPLEEESTLRMPSPHRGRLLFACF